MGNEKPGKKTMIRSIIFTNLLLSGALWGQSAGVVSGAETTWPTAEVAPASPSAAGKPAVAAEPYRNQPNRLAKRAVAINQSVWGIEAPRVKAVESGVMIQFSYRVLDPEKAKVLSDKQVEPLLISMEKGIRLTIPSLEKVGQLRQAPREPEAGKSYWMAFSNSGRLLKPGDRVDIVIGNFRAHGLEVE